MNLQKLRELEEKRTQGVWSPISDWDKYAIACRDKDIFATANRLYRTTDSKHGCNLQDAEFISAFANHAKALLDVVEAAKEVNEILSDREARKQADSFTNQHLDNALKRLEEL